MGSLLPDRHPNKDFFILDVSDAAGAAAAIASIPEDGPIGGVIAAGVVNDGISASHQLVHDWNHRND